MRTLLRVIKFSFQDIFRNISLSFMTVLILVLMLLSINTLIVIRLLTVEATTSIKREIDMSVFFSPQVTDKVMEEVRSTLKTFPEITEIVYLDSEQVLSKFKEDHKSNKDILSSIDELGVNPFGPTLIIKTREPNDYKKIVTALNVPEYDEYIEAKTFGDTEKAIDRIHTITVQVERFSLALSILFAVIAFLIIFNTIRIAIYTQRVEISIKRLVGAANWFIRGPYLVEALFFSALSVIITLGLIMLAAHFLDPYIQIVFGTASFLTNYFYSHIILLFGAQFVSVLLLTIFSSALAMNRYLRV